MSTIIKQSESNGGDARGVPFEFAEIGVDASEPVTAAGRRAAEIIAKAQGEAAAIRRRAEEEGRAAALEAAQRLLDEQARAQITAIGSALRKAVDRIASAKSEWLAHWETAAVQVATAIAGRLVRRELAAAPEITASLVREALELAGGTADVQVRMHPDDVRALGDSIERLAAELGRLGTTQFVADQEMSRGGCRVDTQFGSIDQRFEAQLARIEQELTA